MKQRLGLLFIVFLFFAISVHAVIPQHATKIFAVTSDGKGLEATLSLRISSPGTGKIFSGVDALVGTSTQNAFKVALDVAKNYYSNANQHDYYFEIRSNASIVDGPSAGGATALLLVSMLQDKSIPANVGMTGTISEQGTVGPVGGVFEKAKVAADGGIKLFLIPAGEARQVARTANGIESVNLVEYAPRQWGMKVVEVNNLDEALEFAFSNIETIDINREIEESQTIFVPQAIPYHVRVEPLRQITEQYLQIATEKLEKAKTALNTTILSDPELVSVMFDSLVESENVLEEAQQLFDQNFLYSSANYAFTSIVNAQLVEDIASNPSILNDNSTLFKVKLDALQQELEALKPNLDGRIISDQVDWQIAAQQRWIWARNNVQKLLSTQTIVITDDGSPAQGITQAQLDRLRDYEFAVAWKDIALEFARQLQNAREQVTNVDSFRSLAVNQMVQAENKLPQLTSEDRSDIQRRFEGAESAQALHWYLPMAADAASVTSLVDGENAIQGKDLGQLESLLAEKIRGLDQKLDSPQPYVWARIYLDHARYFQQAIQYYKSQNRTSQAISAAQSGLSVVFLAESAFLSHDEIYRQLGSIESTPYTPNPLPRPQTIETTSTSVWWMAIIGLIIVFSAIIIILVVQLNRAKNPSTAVSTPTTVTEQRRQFVRQGAVLDRELARGNLSMEDYQAKRTQLVDQFSVTPTTTLRTLSMQYAELEKELQDLKTDAQKGSLSPEVFQKRFSSLQKRVSENKSKIEAEKQKLAKHSEKSALPAIQKTDLPVSTSTRRTALDDLADEIKKGAEKKPFSKKTVKK